VREPRFGRNGPKKFLIVTESEAKKGAGRPGMKPYDEKPLAGESGIRGVISYSHTLCNVRWDMGKCHLPVGGT